MYLIIMERICRITKMYARREFHREIKENAVEL